MSFLFDVKQDMHNTDEQNPELSKEEIYNMLKNMSTIKINTLRLNQSQT